MKKDNQDDFKRIKRDALTIGIGVSTLYFCIYVIAFCWLWTSAEAKLRLAMVLLMFFMGIYQKIGFYKTIYVNFIKEATGRKELEKSFCIEKLLSKGDFSHPVFRFIILAFLEWLGIICIAFLTFLIAYKMSLKNQAEILSLVGANIFYLFSTVYMAKRVYCQAIRDWQKTQDFASPINSNGRS